MIEIGGPGTSGPTGLPCGPIVVNHAPLITAVTDSNGKILESHTYDGLGRGLTSSRANGVEAVSVTYGQ